MEPVNKNYVITKQMKFDFQIVLMAKNEKEAAYHADLKEIELWTEVDSNWKITDVSKATNLTIIKSAPQIEDTPETKSKGDDENLGGFNEKTKRKAEALYVWKKALSAEGIKVRAGIVLVVSDKLIYINEKDNFDIEKAIGNDLSDWSPFK